MYDYTPPRENKAAVIVPAILFAAAIVCLICSNQAGVFRLPMQILMAACLVVGIQITTRYALQTHTYMIRPTGVNTFEDEMNRVGEVVGSDGEMWLQIARTQGKNSRVIGGFPLSAVEQCVKGQRHALGDAYKGIARCYSYCNNMLSKNVYTIVVLINGERLSVELEPDTYILSLLKK